MQAWLRILQMFDKAEKEKKGKKRDKKIDGEGEEVGWGDQAVGCMEKWEK
jgi:hypothetical protein